MLKLNSFVNLVDISFVRIKNKLVLVGVVANVTEPGFSLLRHVHKFHMSSCIVFSGKLSKAEITFKFITTNFLNILAF